MGYVETEDWRYRQMYAANMEFFKGMGYSPEQAREKTNTRMRGWVGRSVAIDEEYQKDDRDRANGAGPEGREWFEG